MSHLRDAIDLHVHSAPDVYERSVDDRELVREAERAGMRALLLKSHHTLTADRAQLASAETGIDVFGSITLNLTVGGFNPVAVETAIAFGARALWMPTIHARHCLRTGRAEMFRVEARKGHEGLAAFYPDGSPAPNVEAILELARDAELILGTGHLAPEESLALLRLARRVGVRKMSVTHPLMSFTRFSIPQMRQAVELGALLEFDALSCRSGWTEAVAPAETARAIGTVGEQYCVLGSDGGQRSNPHPPQMLAEFAEALEAEGVSRAALRRMMCENPAALLGI